MKNTLTDLNNYLFESLERIMDDNLSEEELDKEIKRSEAVTSVAKTIISNGDLALRAMRHAEEYNIGQTSQRREMPPMLETGHEKNSTRDSSVH